MQRHFAKFKEDLGARELRALAHPLRIRIAEVLRAGPNTASGLARELGESSGATSYHLRELARFGFIEEDTDRGNGRERWWRRREKMLIVGAAPDDADARAAEGALRSVFLERDEQALDRYLALEHDRDWHTATFIGNWAVHATPEQIREFVERILALVEEIRSAEPAADAERVHLTLRALPQGDKRA